MNKTRKFAVQEAYEKGYEDGIKACRDTDVNWEEQAKRIEKACPQNPCINYEGTVICTHSYDAMLARGLDNE